MWPVDGCHMYEEPGYFYLHPAFGLDELALMVSLDIEFEVEGVLRLSLPPIEIDWLIRA